MKFIALILLLTLTGCADQVTFQQAQSQIPVGFLHGLWHGTILPFAWICSLFDSSTAIYAIYNNGGWYDFGFFVGLGGFSTGVYSSK